MRVLRNTLMLVGAFLLLGAVCAQAGPRPEWAWKNESYMNKKRQNTSYEFKVFKTEDASLTRLQEGRFFPLLTYLGDKYGADPNKMALDSLANGPGEPFTYQIALPGNGRTAVVQAQRVDVFSAVDQNTLGDPIFEYYQLYAVSEKDAAVAFDHFEKGERSRATAALMNVIAPGAGQLYKGHSFKGYALLGSEIALGVTAVASQFKANYYDKRAETETISPESFRNDAVGRRRIRNAALVSMAGLWAFSIFDALTADSMPAISVSAPQGGQLTLGPATSGAGLSLVYRF